MQMAKCPMISAIFAELSVFFMMRIIIIFLSVAMAMSCSGPQPLPRDNWNDDAYDVLCGLISGEGKMSDGYDPECRPNAVFDFDNTTLMNDISLTLMVYQLENMRFAFPPDEAFAAFTAWLPDIDTIMTGVGMSAAQIGRELVEDYRLLCSWMDDGMSLSDLHSTEEYLDFRAKIFALNDGIENTFDYGTWCLWMPALFTGMTYSELQALVRESVDHWMSEGRIWSEHWVSPDGKVSSDVLKGLVLPKESINLYKTLVDNGFDVYICSASLEAIVEVMASDPKYGLGIAPERVFGIRLEDEEKVGGPFATGYDQTFLEGKTACIMRFIAPLHCNKAPSLVAGDSNGDYDMLTAFGKQGVGLIIDCERSGPIAELVSDASLPCSDNSRRYIVQKRDLSIPGYVR